MLVTRCQSGNFPAGIRNITTNYAAKPINAKVKY